MDENIQAEGPRSRNEHEVPRRRDTVDLRKPIRVWSLLMALLIPGLLALLIASFLPLWTVWYWNPHEGLGKHGSLWFVMSEVQRVAITPPDATFPETCNADPQDLTLAGGIFGFGVLLGLLFLFGWPLTRFWASGGSHTAKGEGLCP